jgi:hypothetical protein
MWLLGDAGRVIGWRSRLRWHKHEGAEKWTETVNTSIATMAVEHYQSKIVQVYGATITVCHEDAEDDGIHPNFFDDDFTPAVWTGFKKERYLKVNIVRSECFGHASSPGNTKQPRPALFSNRFGKCRYGGARIHY